jgi:aminotransferase
MKREYRRRRELIIDGLNSLGLECRKPEGAFYAFPSVKKTGMSAMDFAQGLLKEEKVAVVPGTAFGQHYNDYIRISYASSLNNLKTALARMENFLKNNTRT